MKATTVICKDTYSINYHHGVFVIHKVGSGEDENDYLNIMEAMKSIGLKVVDEVLQSESEVEFSISYKK